MRTTKQLSLLKTNYASDVSCYHFIPVFPNFWAVRVYVSVIIYDTQKQSLVVCKEYHLIRRFNEIGGPSQFEHACLYVYSDVSSHKSLKKFGYIWELRIVN